MRVSPKGHTMVSIHDGKGGAALGLSHLADDHSGVCIYQRGAVRAFLGRVLSGESIRDVKLSLFDSKGAASALIQGGDVNCMTLYRPGDGVESGGVLSKGKKPVEFYEWKDGRRRSVLGH
jgi:hypothetical protein